MLINTKAITTLYAILFYTWKDGVLVKESRFSLGAKPEEIEAALNFKTKDEYLQWVKDWKLTYAEISNEIRAYKKARKIGPTIVAYKGLIGDQAASQARTLGWQATALLEARQQAKKRSWELRQVRVAAEAAK